MRKLSLVGFAMVIALTGCGLASSGVESEEDPQLLQEVNGLLQPNASQPLSELVPGQWDTVHVFEETVSRDEVEQKTGTEFDMDDYFSGRGELLIFMNEGKVHRAVELGAARLQPGTYSSEVILHAGPNPGARLQMIDSQK